jgi:hypothetical protein
MDMSNSAVVTALATLAREEAPTKLEDIRTAEDIKKLSAKTLHRLMADPATLEHLNKAALIPDARALADLERVEAERLEAERLAAQQQKVEEETARLQAEEERKKAEKKAAEEQAVVSTPIVPAWQAEDDAYKGLGIVINRDASGNILRIVQDYQVRDENSGEPIGRPTHLEARNWVEFLSKKDKCHVEATRAFNRLKLQKMTYKQQQQPKPATPEEQLKAILSSENPAEAVAAAKKATEVTPDQRAAKAEADAKAALVTYQFLAKHIHDFNNCDANVKLLGEYFQENEGLDYTLENLEIAVKVLEDQLVPPAREVVPPVPNTAPVQPAASAAPAATAAVPVAAAPAASAPPAVAATPATQTQNENVPVRVEPRPGVNSGIQPGSTSAGRVIDVANETTGKLTRREVLNNWDVKTLKARMRDPVWRPQLEALGFKVIDQFRQG